MGCHATGRGTCIEGMPQVYTALGRGHTQRYPHESTNPVRHHSECQGTHSTLPWAVKVLDGCAPLLEQASTWSWADCVL